MRPHMSSLQTKLINGALYARSQTPYAYDLRVLDLGHGHVEAMALPRYAWSELGASERVLEEAAMAQGHVWVGGDVGEWLPMPPPTERELLDRAARNRERSARRARTQVRRLVKAKNLDTMLTLTYRENMVDRSRMARDFDVFMKRVRRVIPGFEYVCVFEPQKRGAWHAHIAVQRVQSHYMHKGVLVKSYDLLRACWRGVVGEGNIDVSRAKHKRQRNVGRLAGYLSKYLAKTFDEGGEGDSYRASGKALPKPVVMRSVRSDMEGAAGELVRLLDAFWPGADFHSAYLDGGGYFVALSP